MKVRKNEMKLRKNEIKVSKNFSMPPWRIKKLHRGAWDFLGGALEESATYGLLALEQSELCSTLLQSLSERLVYEGELLVGPYV